MRSALHHLISRHRRIIAAGKQAQHPPAGFRGQPSGAENLPRINQRRPRRDLNPASKFRLVQINAHITPRSAKLIQKEAPDRRLNLHHRMRKRLIAALRPHRITRKLQRRNFLPGSLAQRIEIPLHRPRHSKVHDAENAPNPFDRRLHRRPVAQPHQKAMPRLLDTPDRNPLEALPQRCSQFARKESPVAALQPQFVIVRDDYRVGHFT